MDLGLTLSLGAPKTAGGVSGPAINTVSNESTGYITDVVEVADLTNQQQITVIYRVRHNTFPNGVNTNPISGTFLEPIQDAVINTGGWRLRVRDSTGANICFITGSVTVATDTWYSVMLAIDIGVDNSIIRYVNGSLADAPAYTASVNNLKNQGLSMFAYNTSGADLSNADVEYVAVYDGYLDPATYYSDFFAVDNSPKLTTGTVGGVSPMLVMTGNAAAYNAGTFDVQNSPSASTVVQSATFADI